MVNGLERASKHIKEKEYDKAFQLFIDWIEQHPDDPIGYVNAGNLCAQLKQMKEAETFLLKAIELDETTATAFVSLGNVYYEQSLYNEAGKMFHHALQLGYEDSDVYYLYGMTYVQTERPLLALPFLQRAVELGGHIAYTFQYGLILAQLHYIDEAERVFYDVLAKDETHVDALYNVAIIQIHRENYSEAQSLLRRTLQLAPDHQLAKNAIEQLKILEREG
ncbi:MAG TPA: tetratricopeptide repeat protein [Pseudogracilibacillus sp.]|nr:tetratricopeptide repeat protein [Pseudogracilibacillus sp.]